MAGRTRRQFTFRARVAAEPMRPEDWQAAERLLARLIARAYAADHPELFRPAVAPNESTQSPGPPAAAAAEGSAPLPSAGGPERMELEHDDSIANNGAG